MTGIEFVRPEGVIPANFSAEQHAQEHEEQQRVEYEDLKARVQAAIVAGLVSDPSAEILVDAYDCSVNNASKVSNKLRERGFQVLHAGRGNADGTVHLHLAIKLPHMARNEEDDGYFSDGWEEMTRASTLKEHIQGEFERQYGVIMDAVIETMKKEPGYARYVFLLVGECAEQVQKWVLADLQTDSVGLRASFDGAVLTVSNPLVEGNRELSSELRF